MVNGRASVLRLTDLFVSAPDVETVVVPIVIKKLQAKNADITKNNNGAYLLNAAALKNWVITPKGIMLLFAAGEIATYAEGDYRITCTWRELEGAKSAGRFSVVVKQLR